MQSKVPQVCAAVLVLGKNGKVLLTKRISRHAGGKYGCPGGKIDFSESIQVGIEREVFEETGLRLHCRPFSYAANCFYPDENNHFFCLWFVAMSKKDEGHSLEGTENIAFIEKDADGNPKAEGWKWYSREDLKTLDLMPSTRKAFEKLLAFQSPEYEVAPGDFEIDEFIVKG